MYIFYKSNNILNMSEYTCIYIYMYECVYVYVYVYIYIYIYIIIYTHLSTEIMRNNICGYLLKTWGSNLDTFRRQPAYFFRLRP